MEERRQFPALRSELESVRRFIARMGTKAGLDSLAIHHCELAVDEAMTNIIEHAYAVQSVDPVIDILCIPDDQRLTIVVTDHGSAFNPLSIPTPDRDRPIEQRQGGGWGIHFIRTVMDEVQYARPGEYNQLRMTKRATHR